MRLLSRHLRRTTKLGGMALALLVGLGLGRLQDRPPIWCAVIVIGLYVGFWLWHKPGLGYVCVLLLCLAAGTERGSNYAQQLGLYTPYATHKATFTVSALTDAVYGNNSQLSFDANQVITEEGTTLVGKIAVSGFGENAIFQGDVVEVTGKLRPASGSYQARLSYAQLDTLGHHQSLVNELRRRFGAGIESALPEPAAPFALGLLIGQRATLPDTVKQDLLMVGLTHIIAVSGYNLTIILQASKNLFARRSKRLSVGFSIFLIGIFLLITGNSASIIRAAIVSMLSIVTSYYGRNIKPLNLILLAAAVTAWWQPSYVWGDMSWYLSFLAFYGVIVLAPLIEPRLPAKLRERMLIKVAIESVCAEVLTLPIVLFVFGQMSRVALIGNLIIAVVVPIAMLFSLIAGLAGMLLPQLAGWISWPAALVLTYMLDTAHVLASLPHVFVEGIGLSLQQMLTLYMLIIAVTLALWFKMKAKSAIITDINHLQS
ncbi:MAG: hypothetical protein JWO41_270 [Candidatus Saccharibacteria bacterium]|nr:hypothetical protein [Candidatus Saccharibacteria bacterium]